MKTDQYAREPLELLEGGIPCFSPIDFYVSNYQAISNDHLTHFEKTGHNPFMNEEHWLEVEDSTAELLRKYCQQGAKILDVGVGMGRLLERFPNLDRYGMDISQGYLQYSSKRGIDVCMSRIEDMPYREDYFDVVVSTDVLEHVFDLNLALTKILGVLKPNGILIGRVPYRENLAGYLDDSFPYAFVHLRSFDEHSVKLLVEKIFNLHLIEWNTAGYISGIPKLNTIAPKFQKLIEKLLYLLKLVSNDAYRTASRSFNYPAEMNFVVRKTLDKVRS